MKVRPEVNADGTITLWVPAPDGFDPETDRLAVLSMCPSPGCENGRYQNRQDGGYWETCGICRGSGIDIAALLKALGLEAGR